MSKESKSDVCVIVEGCYPYVSGGVSSWLHDILLSLSELTFHLVIIKAKGDEGKRKKYIYPDNVVGETVVELYGDVFDWFENMEKKGERAACKEAIKDVKELSYLKEMVECNRNDVEDVCWGAVIDVYKEKYKDSALLEYYWAWQSLTAGLLSVFSNRMPRARIYHALSTGYAGLFLARAKCEFECSTLLTEHGIYTNERQIDILTSNWLSPEKRNDFGEYIKFQSVKKYWMESFKLYARICYRNSDQIISLFEENMVMQRQGGADHSKQMIIPNGVDYNGFEDNSHNKEGLPVVALIGRVVPIKDIECYIWSVKKAIDQGGEFRAVVLGSFDENPGYYDKCKRLVDVLKLQNILSFEGQVNITTWLEQVSIVVLSSVSEGQPLSLLEAGAMGVPCISTNVGCCKTLIYGNGSEKPEIEQGGFVVDIGDSRALSKAICTLVSNKALRRSMGSAMRERVKRYYGKDSMINEYRDLYNRYMNKTQG